MRPRWHGVVRSGISSNSFVFKQRLSVSKKLMLLNIKHSCAHVESTKGLDHEGLVQLQYRDRVCA